MLVSNPNTKFYYDNMLDAQIDAAYATLEDGNETAATVNNARIYNYNLRKGLAKEKGTPLRPKLAAKT